MRAPAAARLLIVDDEAPQMKALCDTLRDEGFETVGFVSARAALAAVRETSFELLLADLAMPEMSGIDLLRAAREVDPDLVGVIVTGEGTIAAAVEAMKVGALDFILKPFKLSVILPVLTRALAMRRLRLDNVELERRLRERAAELELANRELDAFARSVAHELRGPLILVAGFSDVLAVDYAGCLPAEAGETIADIRTGARRMDQLVTDLLRFSRLGQQPVSKQPVDVAALVEEVVGELRRDAAGRHVETLVGTLPPVMADAFLLRQVFVNLIANAYKFTRLCARPVVEIGGHRQEAETVFFVRDNGAGFDMSQAARLFTAFERLHDRDRFPGTGLGLSLVQRIVHRHGGRTWAQGEVDKGATFWIALPHG
jgi:two-component system, sensor histidine kinase and response regulator